MYNADLPKRTGRLGPWQDKVVGPAIQTWIDLRFSERHIPHASRVEGSPAPQQLGLAAS
jgi:hypothetical protein